MILLDTHVLRWWVDGDVKKLSRKARQLLEEHGKRNTLLLCSISPLLSTKAETLQCFRARVARTHTAAP